MVEQNRTKDPMVEMHGTFEDTITINPGEGLETSPSSVSRVTRAMQNSFKRMERAGSRYPSLGKLYGFLFYGPVLRREVKVAGIDKGSRILVIGSGHLPLTGLHLARMGFTVTCVDNDAAATRSAQDLFAKLDENLDIEFVTAAGESTDYSGEEVVWITFNVCPKEDVLRKVISEMKEGGKVVFRNPRGFVRRYYDRVDPSMLGGEHRSMRQIFGKESVILVKRDGCGGCGRRTLCSLAMGCEAVIAHSPADPILNALGIRAGKTVKTLSRQPFGGPLLACVDGRKVAIDIEMAESITLH